MRAIYVILGALVSFQAAAQTVAPHLEGDRAYFNAQVRPLVLGSLREARFLASHLCNQTAIDRLEQQLGTEKGDSRFATCDTELWRQLNTLHQSTQMSLRDTLGSGPTDLLGLARYHLSRVKMYCRISWLASESNVGPAALQLQSSLSKLHEIFEPVSGAPQVSSESRDAREVPASGLEVMETQMQIDRQFGQSPAY